MWGTNPSVLRRSSLFVWSFPTVCHHARGGVYGKITSLPFLPISVWPFDPLLWQNCSANFQVFYRENYFICSDRFIVSVGGGELKMFLCHHLEPGILTISWQCSKTETNPFIPSKATDSTKSLTPIEPPCVSPGADLSFLKSKAEYSSPPGPCYLGVDLVSSMPQDISLRLISPFY